MSLGDLLRRAVRYGREALNLPNRREESALGEFEWQRQSQELGEPQVLVIVTTCARSSACLRLLEELKASLEHAKVESFRLLVVEDTSDDDYTLVQRRAHELFGVRLDWASSTVRHGKRGYWVTYDFALRRAETIAADAVFFVQDDIEWPSETIGASLDLLHRLRSERGGAHVLNLFATADDEPSGRWVKYQRRPHQTLPVRRTQWFDLNAYVIERAALELLNYRMIPVDPGRWDKDPNLSSGVGRQLTRRLSERAQIHQCFPPLVFHGEHQSVMNPGARALRDLDNRELRARPLEEAPS